MCRACGDSDLVSVLDLGLVPAADYFPQATQALSVDERSHPLVMQVCRSCGLSQLADDDTTAEEPLAVEPQALRDHAVEAVRRAADAGWLRGRTLREFGSPHGGSWLPLLTDLGYVTVDTDADVVLDCLGIMHESDQRSAFAQRAAVTAAGGVLLLEYHSLATILRQGQWNALRHGHFAYYSMTTLQGLLGAVGMQVASAWQFDLYGGTVLLAAVHERVCPDESVRAILDTESVLGVTDPSSLAALQVCADRHTDALRVWLEEERERGHRVYAYGAASRAVALFSRAAIDSTLLAGVADASESKQGRRMPGTDIPIVPPAELQRANPDRILLTLPDLLPEVSADFPEFEGRWTIDGHVPFPYAAERVSM